MNAGTGENRGVSTGSHSTDAFHRRIAGIALAAFTFVAAMSPLAGFDTWWQLASGREMVRTGGLLRSDPFSFTSAGKPWVNHEWLWQLGAYGLFEAAGGPGATAQGEAAQEHWSGPESRAASALTIVNAIVLTLAFSLGYAALIAAGIGILPAVIIVASCVWGARARFLVRPETATLVLEAMILAVLVSSRRTGNRRVLASVPLLLAVGANMHPGALAIATVILLFLMGDRFDRWNGRREALPLGWGESLLFAASIPVATLLNPSGISLWKIPFQLSGIVRGESYFNPEWLPSTPERAPLLWFAFSAILIALVLGAVRRAAGDGFRSAISSVPMTMMLPLGALGVLAASGIRHAGLFFVAVPFGFALLPAGFLDGTPRGSSGTRPARAIPAALATALCLALIIGTFLSSGWGLGVDRSTTPVDAAGFIARTQPRGHIYNDVRFGGYLDWRFAPERPSFIDGRNELFVTLLTQLEGIYSGKTPYSAWRELIRRDEIEGALVHYQPNLKGVVYPAADDTAGRQGYRAYSAYLFPDAGWSLVYWDDTAMFFLRRGGENDALIRKFGYEVVNPEDREFQLQRAATDSVFRSALGRDLERRRQLAPVSALALAMESGLSPSPGGREF